MTDREKITKHHSIPSSRKKMLQQIGKKIYAVFFDVSNPKNIIRRKWKRHEAHHSKFENKAPHEQIIQIIEENHEILSKQTQNDLLRILEGPLWKVYSNEVIQNVKQILSKSSG